jgi:hypothetical protein
MEIIAWQIVLGGSDEGGMKKHKRNKWVGWEMGG